MLPVAELQPALICVVKIEGPPVEGTTAKMVVRQAPGISGGPGGVADDSEHPGGAELDR